jgi:hypothetical protein
MPSFTESGLVFSFPDPWAVRRYDQHTYYRGLSGLGLKGMDFLAIDPAGGEQGRLYCLEVKNYLTRHSEDGVFVATPKPPAQLAQTIIDKYADTRRALRAIHGYYRQQWWYRLLEERLARSAHYRFERVFWTQAFRLADSSQQPQVILWLEVEKREHAYCQAVEEALQAGMGNMARVTVATRHRPVPGISVHLRDLSGL